MFGPMSCLKKESCDIEVFLLVENEETFLNRQVALAPRYSKSLAIFGPANIAAFPKLFFNFSMQPLRWKSTFLAFPTFPKRFLYRLHPRFYGLLALEIQ